MTVASLSTVVIPVPAVARVAPHSLGVLLFGPLPSEHYFLTSRGGSTPFSVSPLNLVIPQTGLQPAFSTPSGFLPPPLPLLPHLAGLSRNSVSSYKDLHIAGQINNVSYRNGRPRRPYVPCHVLLTNGTSVRVPSRNGLLSRYVSGVQPVSFILLFSTLIFFRPIQGVYFYSEHSMSHYY